MHPSVSGLGWDHFLYFFPLKMVWWEKRKMKVLGTQGNAKKSRKVYFGPEKILFLSSSIPRVVVWVRVKSKKAIEECITFFYFFSEFCGHFQCLWIFLLQTREKMGMAWVCITYREMTIPISFYLFSTIWNASLVIPLHFTRNTQVHFESLFCQRKGNGEENPIKWLFFQNGIQMDK